MARIAGVDLPREKRVEIGLTYIYGIGLKTSQKILSEAGINPDTRVKDLTEDEVGRIRDILANNYQVEGDLRREVALNIKRLSEIGCYRGIRHRRGLRFVVRKLRLMPVPAKAPNVPWAPRERNKEGRSSDWLADKLVEEKKKRTWNWA